MRIFDGSMYRDLKEEEQAVRASRRKNEALAEQTRPITEAEVLRMVVAGQLEGLGISDARASRMVEFFPELTGSGALITVGTRIRWKGALKRAAVDLWDTPENTPDGAPALWEDVAYRSGIRIIPEVITAGTAFGMDEPGWWGDQVYRSLLESNVWTPEQNPAGWEKADMAM